VIKILHMSLAYVTVIGFFLRAYWSFAAPENLKRRWVRIAPHVVDTLLLVLGVTLAVNLSLNLTSGWLVAKLIGLLAYIGFGVLTLRGSGTKKVIGFVGAVASVGYIFAVAMTKSPTIV
jgi:uncharacterized membrane protein SirB2